MSPGQRNTLLGVIAVVAVGGAIGMFALRGGATTAMPTQYGIHGVCLACKAETTTQQPLDRYPPFTCPSCGKLSVYPWFFCRNCQRRFVPELVRPDPAGPLRLPMGTRCPACGSTDVCQHDPAMGQQPKGDAPLPNWTP